MLRRSNLLAFAAANKGHLNVDKIKQVIATPIADGGVFDDIQKQAAPK